MAQRTEASSTISEFNLTEVGQEKVNLGELINTLKKTTTHATVKKQLENATKQKALPAPLSKPQAEKIKRTVAYEKASEEVGKWDKIVRSNRLADQVVYPLKKPELRLESAEEVAKRFTSKNALEEEVSKLLNNSENVLDQSKVLTAAEEKALRAMSLEEAKARHAELRKMRVLLSHKEAKARRQKKIKSKKYHRILKKEKMKKLMKEFEELQKTDPEAAEEKIKEADKLRVLERMTLKHRSTGKWAKQQKLRAKYNIESRSALKEQVNLGRQLTEKVIPTDMVDKISAQKHDTIFPDSTTANGVEEAEEEDDELLNMYRINYNIDEAMEPVTPLRKEQKATQLKQKTVVNSVKTKALEFEEDNKVDEPLVESVERKQSLEDFENDDGGWLTQNLNDKEELDEGNKSTETSSTKPGKVSEPKKKVSYAVESDFTTGTKFLDSMVPDDITYGEEGVDDVEEDRMNIQQAFADEDFIAEFREDKKAAEKRDRPEGIDLFLPGWGAWGGTGIKPSKRKRKRFYIKPVDVKPRKDSTLGNVIISEEKDAKASVHQVSELPFPFRSVDAFQSIIRQPLGNTWNPETSFQKLVAPKVVTKMGKIIDPMDKDDLVLEKKPESSNPKSKPFKKNKKFKKGKSLTDKRKETSNIDNTGQKNKNKPIQKKASKVS